MELGIPGLQLAPGDHVCAFYRGLSERDEILIPYLREGLRAGDKCICVVDATEPDTVLASLTGEIDLRIPLASHQIDVLSSRQTYLRGGAFCTETMIDFWDQSVGGALRDPGFSFARSVGEMTWALRDMPGVAELVGYESELNRFLPQYPQVILCLYDLQRFSGELVVDIMKTHPKVLVGGAVVENPYYLDPDEFLATIR
ncbi:MAG: MEDS domain-containing protein [Acidimicrobiia bacterium]